MKYYTVTVKQQGTIVFVQGNSSSFRVFKEVMNSKTISQTKIAINLPGHGANHDEFLNDEDFSVINYRKKLIQFINAIDDEVLLAGNSLGGHLVIEIAKDIERLKGLVIFTPPPNLQTSLSALTLFQKKIVVTPPPPPKPVINVKMIDLNRQTLPLYKRLDDKNKEVL
ncbi:alpha/beta fold hydrolase [Flavobacteriaceae bacterium LMO-SS05]